jgi:hypothetical protein
MRSAEQRNTTITSKRNARDKALGFAGPYLMNDHDVYTKATGQFAFRSGMHAVS